METSERARTARRAGLIGLGAVGYLAVSLVLQLFAALALRAAVPGATLHNPAGMTQAAGLAVQLAVSAGSLAIPAALLIGLLRPGRARLGLVRPAPGGLALWTPIALGAAMLANLLANGLGLGAGVMLELPRAARHCCWLFCRSAWCPPWGRSCSSAGCCRGCCAPGAG